MALPVAAQRVALERVVDPLQLQVGERLDPLGDRAAERAQRGAASSTVELGVADPDEADAGDRPAAPLRREQRALDSPTQAVNVAARGAVAFRSRQPRSTAGASSIAK